MLMADIIDNVSTWKGCNLDPTILVESENLTAVNMKSTSFWDIMPTVQ
jgi:hypothetical protein